MESFIKANYLTRCILMGSNGEFYKGKLLEVYCNGNEFTSAASLEAINCALQNVGFLNFPCLSIFLVKALTLVT